MLRIFNFLVIAALLGSASWAYSIKYDTIYFAEKLKRLDGEIERERDLIAVRRADWQLLTRPSRIQELTDRHLDLKPLAATQIVLPTDIPSKDMGEDLLADKLDALATGSVPTPDQGRKTSGKTPGE